MRADRPSGDQMIVLPAPATAKAVADRFTGDVWVDGITDGAGPGCAKLATVRFSPGARTAWHCHAHGQTLRVTDGHGLTHLALSDSGTEADAAEVEWGEHVSDDEYDTAAAGGETERST